MEWGPSNTTVEVQENKRRVMNSNLFSDSNQQDQIRFVQQRINQGQQQNIHNINNNNVIDNGEAATFTKGNVKLLVQAPQASFTGIVHSVQVPALSTFPEVTIQQQMPESISFELKPRTPVRTNHKKLSFRPSNGMKLLRDSLANDLNQFAQKIQQLSYEEPLKIMNLEFPREKVNNSLNRPSETFVEDNGFTKHNKKSPSPRNNPTSRMEDTGRSSHRVVKKNRGETVKKVEEFIASEETPRNLNDTNGMNRVLRASQSLDGTIGFQTVSEFILPDGTTYTDD